MDITLTKFLVTCLVCDLAGFTGGMPLKDASNPDTSTRLKRSPANGFSLFGIKPASFSVQNPIRSAQQTFNSFGNFLSPASRNRNNEKPTESFTNDIKPIQEKPANVPAIQVNNNKDKNTVTSHPDTSINTKRIGTNYDPIFSNENKTNTHALDTNGGNHTPSKYDDANTKDVNKIEIDKSILDKIFNDFSDTTTTEDVTTDYTTETGDYESTTSLDELLRIPAPVVASLLG